MAWSASAGVARETEIDLVAGATVHDAIRAACGGDVATRSVGIWGHVCSLDSVVHAGDRVEVYRPLQIDPKDARRLRAAKR